MINAILKEKAAVENRARDVGWINKVPKCGMSDKLTESEMDRDA